jgi:hypothetical protein
MLEGSYASGLGSFASATEISLSSHWLHTLGSTELLIVTESSCIRIDANHNEDNEGNYAIIIILIIIIIIIIIIVIIIKRKKMHEKDKKHQ